MVLAGAYNSNVLRKVQRTINERHKSKDEYVILCSRACMYVIILKRAALTSLMKLLALPDQPSFARY